MGRRLPPGQGGHGLWAGVDWESFTARWHEWSQQGLRLVDTAGLAAPVHGGRASTRS